VAFRSVIPYFHWSTDYVLNVVAVLGTTITPYCFFWQANQEAEEGFARGRVQFIGQGIPVLAKGDLRNMRADTLNYTFRQAPTFYAVIPNNKVSWAST
jgi:hypothetical protein